VDSSPYGDPMDEETAEMIQQYVDIHGRPPSTQEILKWRESKASNRKPRAKFKKSSLEEVREALRKGRD
jgi:hypothetical protein